MSKTGTPDLSALIARKGTAGATRPTTPPAPAAAPVPLPAPVAALAAPLQPVAAGKETKVSVGLDPARYRTLQLLAIEESLSHKDLMIKALDEYVARRSRPPGG